MGSSASPYRKHLYVCLNRREEGKVCCAAGGSEAIRERLKAYVAENGLKGKVRVSGSGCMDLCAQGPNVMVYPDNVWYRQVTLEDVERIIEKELAPLVGSHPRESEGQIPALDRVEGGLFAGMTAVRAFLFDLGNVLVRFDHMAAASRIVDGTGASPDMLCQLFFESPLVVDHDEGRITTRQFYEGIRRQIGLDLPYGQFLAVWNDIFAPDEEMLELLGRLLTGRPCYLISNTNRPHFEHLRKLCPVLNRMSGWILSYEVGHLKPHPAIYRRALELAGCGAEEILYVDDREDLTEAARGMGFQTHRFTDYPALKRELSRRGLGTQYLFPPSPKTPGK